MNEVAMEKFQILSVTPELISSASADWKSSTDIHTFTLEYGRFFEETLPNSHKDFFAIALNDSGVILAIVELISSQGARKTKLIQVTVHPSLLPLEESGNQTTLVNVYFAAIKKTFDLAHEHNVTEVKVYGRTDHMLKVLENTEKLLDESPMDGFSHVLQSRWLTFYAR